MAKRSTTGFTDEERAAMRERARELKAEERAGKDRADGDAAVRAKIAEMPEPDRTLAERVHVLVGAAAPALTPRLWYGMPAYARDGKVLCFFQGAAKFGTRYATLGFTDVPALDDGTVWPVAFALTAMTAAEEATIRALVEKAAG